MQKWEYKMVEFFYHAVKRDWQNNVPGAETMKMQELANVLGAEGWELTSTIPFVTTEIIYGEGRTGMPQVGNNTFTNGWELCFKRPIAE